MYKKFFLDLIRESLILQRIIFNILCKLCEISHSKHEYLSVESQDYTVSHILGFLFACF